MAVFLSWRATARCGGLAVALFAPGVATAQSASARLAVTAIVAPRCAVDEARPADAASPDSTVSLRCSGRPARTVTARLDGGPPARVTALGPNDVRIRVPRSDRERLLTIDF